MELVGCVVEELRVDFEVAVEATIEDEELTGFEVVDVEEAFVLIETVVDEEDELVKEVEDLIVDDDSKGVVDVVV